MKNLRRSLVQRNIPLQRTKTSLKSTLLNTKGRNQPLQRNRKRLLRRNKKQRKIKLIKRNLQNHPKNSHLLITTSKSENGDQMLLLIKNLVLDQRNNPKNSHLLITTSRSETENQLLLLRKNLLLDQRNNLRKINPIDYLCL